MQIILLENAIDLIVLPLKLLLEVFLYVRDNQLLNLDG